MAQAVEGALAALRRVAGERAADCVEEVARHRSWLLNCAVEAKSLLAQQRAGGAAAVPVKRARGKKGTTADLADQENVEGTAADAVERAARSRRGRQAPSVEADAPAAEQLHAHDAAASAPDGDGSHASLVESELLDMHVAVAPDIPRLAGSAARAALSEPEVLVLPGPAAVEPEAQGAAVIDAAPPCAAPDAAVLDALTAAAAVPLPCDALPAPAAASQPSPVADARSAKPNSKLLALQAAELARKQEERINEERQAKKEVLERQREAARRAAAQSMPTLKDAAAHGDGPAKLLPRPPASGAAFSSKPGENASKALPRLKQAMEARAQLTEANRRNLELAHKEKDEKSAALKHAEEDAKMKAEEEQRTCSDEVRTVAKEQQVEVDCAPASADHPRSAVSSSGGATAQLKMPKVPAAVLAPAPVYGGDARPAAAAAPVAPAPLYTPAAPPRPAAATPAAASLAAVAAPPAAELQSYEISPYKSGSDSDEDVAERPRKPVPAWARSEALAPVLYAQAKADPDAIFQNPSKTCSLDEVFQCAGNKKRDFSRRGSSGNWTEDQLTWKEEQSFKRRMGYASAADATPRSVHSGSRATPGM